ncbi:unnamed protein product [Vitrella brassicaformis CCMP3155]|uniref:U2A'/phosphoprotein 32 family A C-terminal domain-containing protein n=1 Tax=Vitrella brassicaformis (strain CCMP3155) TaxID=1169540 RepID=A0A0G4EDL8_VITBC|nr:unnamed protein product [Vitrella brassicaformis CCMP3155]|eukprot:CEL93479.1 unnamed protein product [Vitrella brassicaformis CCMP3155]
MQPRSSRNRSSQLQLQKTGGFQGASSQSDSEDIMAEEGSVLEGDLLRSSLSQISKTVDGSGYAFARLDCSGKEVSSLAEAVGDYTHIRFVQMSNNQIKDITPVSRLPHVLSLNCSQNGITQLECLANPEGCLPFCQTLDASTNAMEKLGNLKMERLKRANVSGNQIASLEGFEGHEAIEVLNLSKNKLINCQGIGNLPALKELFMSENEIKSLEGLQELPSLDLWDLSGNKLDTLDGFGGAASITTLLLKENQVSTVKEFEKLRVLPKLRKFDATGNPIVGELGDEAFRIELLIVLTRLTEINGQEVTPEERQQAKGLEADRIRQEEERKKAEEEAAAAAEKEGEEADQ